MQTIIISQEVNQKWKVYCEKKGIQIKMATEIALELAMNRSKTKTR